MMFGGTWLQKTLSWTAVPPCNNSLPSGGNMELTTACQMSLSPTVAFIALYVGGVLSLVAGLLHFACIFIGAPAFRFLGAGEDLAKAAERGLLFPSFVAFGIGSVLVVWSAYAFSAIGVGPSLPLTKYALAAISFVYLARALGFPLLQTMFPDNSFTFWLVTSAICLVMGLSYLLGLLGLWSRL